MYRLSASSSMSRCLLHHRTMEGQRRAFSRRTPSLLQLNNNGTPEDNHNNNSTSSRRRLEEGGGDKAEVISFGAALKQFLLDTFSFGTHNVSTATSELKSSVVNYAKFVTENDKPPEEQERERKKREAYNEVRNKQQAAAKEKETEMTKNMGTLEWLKYKAATLKESAKEATSKKQGMIALVQHCTAAHAAEVAVEQGIDVKSVNVVLEESKTEHANSEARGENASITQNVVGYIDAPGATEEEVMQFAERLTKACPAANTMRSHIEWRQVGGGVEGGRGGKRFVDDDDATMRGLGDFRGAAEGGGDVGFNNASSSPVVDMFSGFSASKMAAAANKKESNKADEHHYRRGSGGGGRVDGGTFDNPFTGLNISKKPPTKE